MTGNKYYYRAEVYFGDKGAVFGDKRSNFDDCIAQFNHFLRMYATNSITCARIQKRYASNDKEFWPSKAY